MTAREVKKVFFLFPIAAAIFLFFSQGVLALDNAGFESGNLMGWETYSGSVASVVGEGAHGGSYAALVENSSTYSYGIQQLITGIKPGRTYRVSGFIKLKDDKTAKAMFRIAWYESNDGSGSQESTQDSEEITSAGDWIDAAYEATAPENVSSAKFRAVLSSKVNGDLAGAYFDDLSFEILESPTPTQTPVPTPTLSPTPTDQPSSATCQINEVKDENGQTVSSVKIYVDGVYLHHYAPETLTFCDGCSCDGYTACGFGQHQIELEKTGFKRWSGTKDLQPGSFFTINAVLGYDQGSQSSSTPSPTHTLSPTPTPKTSLASVSPTPSGEVLGEVAPESDYYPLEEDISSENKKNEEISEKDNSADLAKLFFGSGMVFLFSGSLWGWYTVKEKGLV